MSTKRPIFLINFRLEECENRWSGKYEKSFTGYWGISLIRNSLDLLPRCELSKKYRYDMRMVSFRRLQGVYSYSRNLKW